MGISHYSVPTHTESQDPAMARKHSVSSDHRHLQSAFESTAGSYGGRVTHKKHLYTANSRTLSSTSPSDTSTTFTFSDQDDLHLLDQRKGTAPAHPSTKGGHDTCIPRKVNLVVDYMSSTGPFTIRPNGEHFTSCSVGFDPDDNCPDVLALRQSSAYKTSLRDDFLTVIGEMHNLYASKRESTTKVEVDELVKRRMNEILRSEKYAGLEPMKVGELSLMFPEGVEGREESYWEPQSQRSRFGSEAAKFSRDTAPSEDRRDGSYKSYFVGNLGIPTRSMVQTGQGGMSNRTFVA